MPANIGTALHEREGLEEEGTKKRVGVFLENPWVEVVIVILILADVVLVTIELAIDHNYACVNGSVLKGTTPEKVVESHAAKHGLFFLQTLAAGAWGHGFSSSLKNTLLQEKNSLSVAPMLTSNFRRNNGRYPSLASTSFQVEPSTSAHAVEPMENEEYYYDPAQIRGGEINFQEPKEGHEDHAGGHGEGGHEHAEGGHGHGHGHGHAHGHGHHPQRALVCETKYGPTAHHIMHTCHTLSICILVVFFVELMLKMWIAPKEFCADWLHLLDLFVVTTSLLIDIYVSYLIEEGRKEENMDAAMIAQLLLIMRLWRVVRIAHGFNEIRNIELEKRHKEIEELEEKKEAEKARLEAVIRKHGLEAEVEAA